MEGVCRNGCAREGLTVARVCPTVGALPYLQALHAVRTWDVWRSYAVRTPYAPRTSIESTLAKPRWRDAFPLHSATGPAVWTDNRRVGVSSAGSLTWGTAP